MGAECCKANSNVGSLNLYPEFTNDPDLKNSINRATNLLRRAQNIKQTLKLCKEKSVNLTGLPMQDALSFLQNLQVLLWTLSASYHGKIQQAGFVVSPVAPYFDIKSSQPNSKENCELLQCLQVYFTTVSTEARVMKEITEDLYALKREVNKWHQLREIHNNKEEEKAASYKRLADEMKDIEIIEEDLRQANAKVPWMIEKAQLLVAKADEVGYQADREHLYDLKSIVNRFRVCLETGQEKKKWVMRVSTEDGTMQTRESNANYNSRRMDTLTNVTKSTENNREELKQSQLQNVTFRPNPLVRSNSKGREEFQRNSFTAAPKRFSFRENTPPIGNKNIKAFASFDRNKPIMKNSNIIFKIKAEDLKGAAKSMQLNPQQNPFAVTRSNIPTYSVKAIPKVTVKDINRLDLSKIKEKANASAGLKPINTINENLEEEEALSISAVQNSDRKNVAKKKWSCEEIRA